MNTTITKSQLRNLIRESVSNMINEIGDTNRGQYMLGRVHARNTDKYVDSLDAGDEDTDARSNRDNAADNWARPTRADGKIDFENDPFGKGEDDQRNGDPLKIHDRYNVYKYKDQFDLRDKFIKFIESDDKNLQDIFDYENGYATGNVESALTELIPRFEEQIGYEVTPQMRKTIENAYNEWLYYARENGFLVDESTNRNITTSQIRNLVRESIRKMVNEAFQKPDNRNETEWNGTYTDDDGALYMPDDDLPEEENTDIKSEVEAFVREFSNGHQIEQWLSENSFVDDHGFDGHIFNDEMEAEESILNGENLQNAIDYVDGATTEEEWIQMLDKHSKAGTQYVRNIVEQGQWDKVVELILQIDGPEFFLAPYSGKTHDLSNGQILYY